VSDAILPYAGTSGWSGSETSKQRATDADKSGKTRVRQVLALNHIRHNADRGLTWKDLSEITNWHHGTASGVLSVLHKAGKIERLKQTRDKCAIYVAPEFVLGSVTAKPKIRKCKNCGHAL
jgi:hypothetical protein